MDLKSIVKDLYNHFKKENFGIKSILHQPLNYCNKRFYVYLPGKPPNNEYDCLTSCIEAQEILKSKGITSLIYCGKDKNKFWVNHTFLKIGEKIIDFTPQYRDTETKHEINEILNNDLIQKYKQTHKIYLDNFIPFYQGRNFTLRIGLEIPFWIHLRNNQPVDIEVLIDMLKEKNNEWAKKGYIRLKYSKINPSNPINLLEILKTSKFIKGDKEIYKKLKSIIPTL